MDTWGSTITPAVTGLDTGQVNGFSGSVQLNCQVRCLTLARFQDGPSAHKNLYKTRLPKKEGGLKWLDGQRSEVRLVSERRKPTGTQARSGCNRGSAENRSKLHNASGINSTQCEKTELKITTKKKICIVTAQIQWLFYFQKASLKYLQFVQKHLKVSRTLHCKFNLKAHTWNNINISSWQKQKKKI